MKKNIIISAMVFALAGATTSCSDFLDKEVDLTQPASWQISILICLMLSMAIPMDSI